MSIEFYYMPESPYSRTVEMVAELVGVKLNKHYINLQKGDQLQESYVKLNPRHVVPFIIDGDLKLNESRAIARYLVNKYKPDDKYLYPQDPHQRALIDEMLDFELGSLVPAAYKLLRPLIFTKVAQLDSENEKSYRAVLQYIDDRLGHNGAKRFLFHDHLTIADISLTATMTFPAACGYDLHDFKHIVAYLERTKAIIPRYSEINDAAVESMKSWIKSKQEAK